MIFLSQGKIKWGRCIIGKIFVSQLIAELVILAPVSTSPVLERYFRQFSPALRIHRIANRAGLDLIAENVGRGARLVSFGTDVIVSAPTLSHFRFGAYNFHPGPPSYPGWAPESFAFYDGARIFGATAHLMTERVDSGPIIGTELFLSPPGRSPDQLATDATKAVGRLLLRLGVDLVRRASPLPELPIRWGDNRGTKAKLARLQQERSPSSSDGAAFLVNQSAEPRTAAAARR